MKYEELVKALRCCATMTCKGDDCRYMILGCHDCFSKLHDDAAAAIEELQAEVERLKVVINELREAKTFIDHYGTQWLTSAKDVPTAAYNHGYADGFAEAKMKMEVQE